MIDLNGILCISDEKPAEDGVRVKIGNMNFQV
jgi:hypothetical protein